MGPSDRGCAGRTTRWVARHRVCDEDHPTTGLHSPHGPRYTGAQAPTNVSPGGTAWGDDAAGTDCEGIVGRTASGQHRRWRRRVLAAEQARGVVNCPICGVALDYEHSMRPNSAEPDHVVAFKFGGGYELSNGRALCRRCNQRRGDGSRDVVNATQVKIATTDVVW